MPDDMTQGEKSKQIASLIEAGKALVALAMEASSSFADGDKLYTTASNYLADLNELEDET